MACDAASVKDLLGPLTFYEALIKTVNLIFVGDIMLGRMLNATLKLDRQPTHGKLRF